MNPVLKKILVPFLILIVLTSACKANVARNGDGSVDVETSITQQQLQEIITSSIADPLIKELTVSLQSGYVLVSGTRERLNDPSKSDSLTFRLDLTASNGQLNAVISNAQLDNVPLEQSRIAHWNETISNRISILSGKRPGATIKSVTVTSEAVTMIWSVSK